MDWQRIGYIDDDRETFPIPPLMPKRTIHTRDERGWIGAGGACVRGRVAVEQKHNRD